MYRFGYHSATPTLVAPMHESTVFIQDDDYAKTEISDYVEEKQPTGPTVLPLTLRDLQAAAVDGVITNLQASKLWARLSATPTSPGFMETAVQPLQAVPSPKFGFVNVVFLAWWLSAPWACYDHRLRVHGRGGLAGHWAGLLRGVPEGGRPL
jgi:hypothetical protein